MRAPLDLTDTEGGGTQNRGLEFGKYSNRCSADRGQGSFPRFVLLRRGAARGEVRFLIIGNRSPTAR